MEIANIMLGVEEAERRVREFVVPLLDELPEQKLWDGQPFGAFLSQANGLNDWWLLPISEKSPLSSWIQDFYGLAMIHRACREKTYAAVRVGINDRLLRHVVASGLSVPTFGKGGLFLSHPCAVP